MEFTNLVDLVKVFANEYCKPNFMILVNGVHRNLKANEIKDLFSFINSEVIVIDDQPHQDTDIVTDILPFESHSFDLIISFKYQDDDYFKRVLKPNGKLLFKSSSLCELIYFKFGEDIFCIK